MKVPVNCITCGIEFLKQECWFKRAPNHFCTKNCHDVFQRSKKIGKLCEICGKEFLIRPCEDKKFVTCNSPICRRIKKIGARNPNWRGGISDSRLLWDSSKEAKDWKRAVFSRDNYTCQDCGNRGGDLEAHHIRPWSLFPKRRCELSNGMTLCLKCHKKTFKEVKSWRLIAMLENINDESGRERKAESRASW